MKIILSRYQQNLDKYIYSDIKDNLCKGKISNLIVPKQFTLQTELDMINNIGKYSLIDVREYSFSSFAREILQNVGGIKRETITTTGKSMLISKILSELNDELSIFKDNSKNDGFIEGMSNLLSELKNEKISAESLYDVIQKIDDINLRNKLHDINLISDRYNACLEGKYIDSDDKLSLAIEKVKEADYLRDTQIYLNNFSSLSVLQIEFLIALERVGVDVTFALNIPFELSENLDDKVNNGVYCNGISLLKKLRKMSRLEYFDAECDEIAGDLAHLSRNFASYSAKKYSDDCEHIFVKEFATTEKEVENIANLINKLVKEEGVRYRDIAITATNFGEYDSLIKKVFIRNRLPYYADNSRSIGENHITKTMMAFLRLFVFNFRQDDIEFVLKSGIFFIKSSELAIIDFINYIKNRKIYGAMFFDEKYFYLDGEFYKGKSDRLFHQKNTELLKIKEVLSELILNNKEFYEFSRKQHTVREFCEQIYYLFSSESFVKGIDQYILELQKFYDKNIEKNIEKNTNKNVYSDLSVNEFYIKESQQIWDKMMNILDELVNILGDEKINIRDMYSLIEQGVKNVSVGVPPMKIDEISVGSLQRSIPTYKKYHFIVGMSDIFYPSIDNTNSILADDDISVLSDNKIDINVNAGGMYSLELFSLYKIITSSDNVIFTSAKKDSSSSLMRLSRDVIQIGKMFDLSETSKIFDIEKYTHRLKYNEILENIIKYRSSTNMIKLNDMDETEKKEIITFVEYLKNQDEDEVFRKALCYSNKRENISGDLAKKLYFDRPDEERAFSASQIDTYAKCPYQHFMRYGIRPNIPRKYEIETLDVGNLVHAGLSEFNFDVIKEDDLDAVIDDIFDKCIKENVESNRADISINKYFISRLRENARTAIKMMIYQQKQGDFKVSEKEKEFNKDKDYPEVAINDIDYIRGKIDRIDTYENYAVVMDYKTGDKKFDIDLVLNGLDLQLMIYMLSVEKKDDKEVVGIFYTPIKDNAVSYSEFKANKKENIYIDRYKRSGIVLGDKDILRHIDCKIDDAREVTVFAPGNPGSGKEILKREKVYDKKEFDDIKVKTLKIITEFITNINAGDIKINPFNQNKSGIKYELPCGYCDFGGVCKFELASDMDKIRALKRGE
ncbi:MAG: exodeoxyribonuclease V subunit gamma [Eubacteriales bacterium]|nr:exodeoxyribonuclease V subunit gamma [Eubacteriales bacterium]MDY3332721.1 PD-(D/E)XK nuclease family protein [Gallibacter sp.]